jgi:hypothetical protein
VDEREDALKATTDDLIADSEELASIEHRKASLAPDDPRQDQLATRAEAIVREMVPKATVQREIVTGPEDVRNGTTERTSDGATPSGLDVKSV